MSFKSISFQKIIAYCLAVLFWAFGLSAQALTESFKIQAIDYQANTQALIIQTEGLPKNFSEQDYRFVRLKEPEPEFVISLPRGSLTTAGNRNLVIDKQGLKNALITQPSQYSGVLIRIKTSNYDLVQNAQIKFVGSQIQIQFNPNNFAPVTQQPPQAPVAKTPPGSSVATPPITSNSQFKQNLSLNQLNAVQVQNTQITLLGRPQDKLLIKNRMVLESPKRLVLDLGQTQIFNESLKNPIRPNTGWISQIRVGQFDQDTTRLVIETTTPELITASYPLGGTTASQNQIVLSLGTSSLNTSVQNYDTLPTEVKEIGYIQDVWVSKAENNRAIIRVVSSVPMAKALQRQGNTLTLQMLNLIGREAPVYFKKQDLPFINDVRVAPLQATEPNVRLVVKLNEEPKAISQFLSKDGKLLEITIESTGKAIGNNQPLINDLGPLPRAPGRKLIVVDAGHGGKDAGATREGIYEKNMTLSIALKLRDVLQKMGYQVHMTRDVDKFLELSEITAITNRVKPDLFVSVHINSSTNPGLNGLETYYYHDRSLPLAKAIHRQMVAAISAKDNNVRRAKFYVINHTSVPAVLCEVGYISNAAERGSMLTPQRQQATAEAIARGVTDFLNGK